MKKVLMLIIYLVFTKSIVDYLTNQIANKNLSVQEDVKRKKLSTLFFF